jgi:hypothetical protein
MGRSGLVGLGAWASESDESSEWQPRGRIRGMRVIGWRARRAWDVPPPVVGRCLAFLFAENHGHNSVRRFSPVSAVDRSDLSVMYAGPAMACIDPRAISRLETDWAAVSPSPSTFFTEGLHAQFSQFFVVVRY